MGKEFPFVHDFIQRLYMSNIARLDALLLGLIVVIFIQNIYVNAYMPYKMGVTTSSGLQYCINFIVFRAIELLLIKRTNLVLSWHDKHMYD